MQAIVQLEDIQLWQRFNGLTNEMIVTKGGRRMFPVVRVTLKNLEPRSLYAVSLEMRPADNYRWKYMNGEWMSTGKAEHQKRKPSIYIHPESPNFGAHWMKEVVTFSKVKLTNSASVKNNQDQLHINSLHKYEPYVKLEKLGTTGSELVSSRHCPEARFIAVTAYQNDEITGLKITYNPFAKAFQDQKDKSCNSLESNEKVNTSQTSDATQINPLTWFPPTLTHNPHTVTKQDAPKTRYAPYTRCYETNPHYNNTMGYDHYNTFAVAMGVHNNCQQQQTDNQQSHSADENSRSPNLLDTNNRNITRQSSNWTNQNRSNSIQNYQGLSPYYQPSNFPIEHSSNKVPGCLYVSSSTFVPTTGFTDISQNGNKIPGFNWPHITPPELSTLFSELWDLDENRCEPDVDYELDLQGYVTSTRNMRRDRAEGSLFSYLNEEDIFSRPTYKAFRRLLDNYCMETGEAEVVTRDEVMENRSFIEQCYETKVIQRAHEYLVEKGAAPEGKVDFWKLLYKIWFKLYRRTKNDADYDSSGFEHVFVGETREHSVIGFHNWIQFYLQEKRGKIDYRGFFRRGTTNESSPRLVTLQFLWGDNQVKPIGSSFIGTSPEYEFAIYTILFLLQKMDSRTYPAKIDVTIKEEYEVKFVCYAHADGIGTAYPESLSD